MSQTLSLHLSSQSGPGLDIDVSGTDGFILGRSDSRSSYVPDIDLAPFQALDKGVSRRHAAFVRHQGRIHLLDLASVNGTFLNGKRLKAEMPYLLKPGDQIGLGDLVLTIQMH